MGVRARGVAVLLMVMAACTSGSGNAASVGATTSTNVSSVPQTSISSTTSTTTTFTSTASTMVEASTGTAPPELPACVPEPAQYLDPSLTAEVRLGVSGTQRIPIGGTTRLVVGDGQLWFHHTDAPAELFKPATVPSDVATALVSFDPPCRAHLLRGGPELLAMSCHDLALGEILPGPCWVTRHDAATGAISASYGPYVDVADVGWVGDDLILRTVNGLEAPALDWAVSGDFAPIPALGIDGAVFQVSAEDTLRRYDLAGGPVVDRPIDVSRERILGLHAEGLIAERRLTDDPPTYELVVWEVDTLEETVAHSISGPASLLDSGEVVVQRALVEGAVPREEDFRTEILLLDIATGEEALVTTIDDYLLARGTWPTANPHVVLDGELIVGTSVYSLP